MEDLELFFTGLDGTDVPPRLTKGTFDRSCNLLVIHGWHHLLSKETILWLTIAYQTYEMEYTWMNEPGQVAPFKMEVPPWWFPRPCVATMTEVRRIGISDVEGIPEVNHFLVTSERSCRIRLNRRRDTFLDETCPENEGHTRLSADWIPDDCVPKAVLVINSTKTWGNVSYWRITVSEAGDATGNDEHVLLIPWDARIQTCVIPPNILKTGARYDIIVEGLQLSEDGFDSLKCFRLISRCFAILETPTIQAFHGGIYFNLQIERTIATSASLVITTNQHAGPVSRKWKIKIKKIVSGCQNSSDGPVKEFEEWAIGDRQSFDIPLDLQPGHHYCMSVQRQPWHDSDWSYLNGYADLYWHSINFRADLTLKDIRELHNRAVRHAAGSSLPCHVLYRNKNPEYFEDILRDNNGIMEAYEKDNSGDPASPINLRINGLCFMASVSNKTKRPFKKSYFGSRRICIPAQEMLRMAPKLYFSDYYCMSKEGSHYVTLVMTRPDSEPDKFCENRLLPLDYHDRINNPFLFYDDANQLRVAANAGLLVEVLFTKDIDICKYELKTVKTQGKGRSTPGGKCKYSPCAVCNLPRRSPHPKF